ncbi:MAG: CBS domain-containing protein [Proteobacteria bacterium]|nr:MAG: CBS domain-containing protein [Pseudomonadota bacterium]
MFVSRSMVSKVITIDRNASVFEAQEKMATNGIRHLPIVTPDNHLIGIVTDRDIRSAMPYSLIKEKGNTEERAKLDQLKVEDIMTHNPKTISPMYTIQDALLMIQKEKIGAFPVVDDDGRLKGILSVRDLLRAFIIVLGIGQPGTLVGIEVEEKVGELKKIVDVITEENISLGSVVVAQTWDEGKRAVFPYLLTNNVAKVKKRLKADGFALIDPMEWYIDRLPGR